MAKLIPAAKACAENPLKSSAPLGAALAYLGIEGSMPLFHGSQGCTSFALVLAVRHFKEAIPLQTTAMDEPATVLGGADNLATALINIQKRAKPKFIGIASTALVETRGEDIRGELKKILKERSELADTSVVFAATPDFEGALEEGWSRAVAAIVEALVPEAPYHAASTTLNLLAGVHDTPGTIEEVCELAAQFGLRTRVLPDLSTALDGSIPDEYVGTSLGGTALDEIRRIPEACHTLALGSHMAEPARIVAKKTGMPVTVLPTALGLEASDRLVCLLSELSGRDAPPKVRRERGRLLDAMLDAHFALSGKRVAVGADPDLLSALVRFLVSLGAEVPVAISSTKALSDLESLPCDTVQVGDLGDLEALAREAQVDLLFTHGHGRQAAKALQIPLFRIGFPIFDRLGHPHRSLGGYRGTRELLFEIANLCLSLQHEAIPEQFARDVAQPIVEETAHVGG